ncbi:MAG TPA: hypothetical protein GX500_02015 [Firmicutes bacterium]|nr:hypothetical protein [Candidatus Fermentithermobacillaceae bacterium]
MKSRMEAVSAGISRVLKTVFGDTKAALRAGICFTACLLIIVFGDPTWSRLHEIALLLGLLCTAFFTLKRRIAFIVLIVALRIPVYGVSAILSEARESPEAVVPEIHVSVTLGGDLFHTRVSDQQCWQAVVCFYKNRVAVVAAHSCSMSPGLLDEHTFLNEKSLDERLTALEDTPWGLAVSPIDAPEPRDELPIANASDVLLGERAVCITPGEEPFEVTLEGWITLRGRQYLVASATRRGREGMSGSPVVQNGRIVGFLAGTWPLSIRPPHIIYLSPAPLVYSEFRDYLDGQDAPR